MSAQRGPDRYLLGVANELGRSVLPHVQDANAAFLLQSCCRVLVGLAAQTTASIGPEAGLPREIPLMAGAARERADQALARAPTWTAQDRLELAAFEGELMDRYMREAAGQLGAMFTTRSAEEADPEEEALQAWLRELDQAPALRVTSVHLAQAGYSKRTIIIGLEGARTLPDRIVVRADPPRSAMPTSVLSEFALLNRLHAAGVAVPKPLFAGAADGPLEAPFMVVEAVSGGLDGHLLTAPAHKETALDLARQLGRLHAIEAAQITDIALPMPPSGPWPQAVAELKAQWLAQQHAPSLSVTLALDWMAAAAPRIAPMERLIHGDVGFHNILVDQGAITAILDWELARIGHPGEDLGYIRSVVEQRLPWAEFMEAYRAAGGPEQHDLSVTFFVLFTSVRLLLLMFATRDGFERGDLDSVKAADATVHYLVGVVHLISREVRNAMQRHGALPAPMEEG